MPTLDVLNLINTGSTVEDILAKFRETAMLPDEPALWRRCALLRFVDPESYPVVSQGLQVRPFEQFAQDQDLSVVSTTEKSYAVSEPRRQAAFREWRDDPSGLQAFASRMAIYYDGRKQDLDALAMKVVTNAPDAAADFERLYGQADEGFNVPRCTLLLEILRVRYDLLDPAMRTVWSRYDAYLRARTLFSDDYHRSATYLERNELTEKFDAFWKDPNLWLLELFGAGGVGKTMFVRWLISRRCIPTRPGGTRIAVARLDFDLIQLSSFASWPWLSLQPIARQLSPQIENNRLKEFVDKHQAAAGVLKLGRTVRPELAPQLRASAQLVPADFQSALGQQDALLILDTCEDPLLHQRSAFKRFLEMLAEIRSTPQTPGVPACTGLRVLLSGRYRVTEKRRLPEIAKIFEGHLASIEVERFDSVEAKRYLRSKRGITGARMVDAIVEKSNGNPFSLGLFADLWHSPGLKVEQVREAPPNEFIYLLDRVVLRIPQKPVRWLLRYASIPRELTFDFVEKVLSPLLPRGEVSESELDRANDFEEALSRYRTSKPWPKARMGELKKVWGDLLRYASNPSWITVDEDTGTVKLHADVVEPMRALLRTKTELFTLLQEHSEQYWQSRASRDRGNWGRYTAEGLFHRFQRLGSGAAKDWAAALRHPFARTAVGRKQLADVLLTAFLDEDGKPRANESGRMVDEVTLARAQFEAGYAALVERLRLGRLDPSGPLSTNELEDRCKSLEATPRAVRSQAASDSALRLLQSGVRFFSNRTAMTPAAIRAVHQLTLPRPQRLTARVLAFSASYARVLQGLPASVGEYSEALQLSKDLRSEEFPPQWIEFREGMSQFRRGQLAEAARGLTSALDQMFRVGRVDASLEGVFWRLISVLRLRGEIGRAEAAIGKLEVFIRTKAPKRGELRFQSCHARALMALDLGDPLEAQRWMQKAAAYLGMYDSDPAWHELAGLVAGELMDMAQVDKHFDEAVRKYPEAGWGRNFAEIRRAAAHAAIGDARGARIKMPPTHSWQQALEMMAVRVRDRFRRTSFRPLFEERSGPPELRLQVAAKALAHERLRSPQEFFDQLATLDSGESRYRVLIPFGETRRILRNWREWREIAAKVLPAPPSPSSRGFAVQAIALANARRFFGDLSGSLEMLAEIPAQKPFLQRQILRARFSAAPEKPLNVDGYLDRFGGQFEAFPLLCCAARTEAAEWLIAWRKWQDARRVLSAAEADLQRSGTEPCEWTTRFEQASARVADAESDLQSVERHSRRARESSLRTGDLASQQEVDSTLHELPVAQADQPLVRKHDTWTFQSGPSAAGFEMSFQLTGRGGGRFMFTWPPWLSGGLNSAFAATDLQSSVVSFGTFVEPFLVHLTPEGGGLRLSQDVMSALPWEFLAPQPFHLFYRARFQDAGATETVRWMQATLVSLGFTEVKVTGSDSETNFRDALSGYYLEGEITPHRGLRDAIAKTPRLAGSVWLAESSVDWQLTHKRGYALESADLENAYRIRSFSPLRNQASGSRPDLLHIVAGLQQDNDGVILLDLEPGSIFWNTSGGKCDAAGLARFLNGWPVDAVRPLVIVDIPLPPDTREANRQALLRNLFCAQLFELGGCRAVAAVGMSSMGIAAQAFDKLTMALQARPSLEELHRQLSTSSTGFVPPALWTDDPDLPAWQY